MKKLLLLALLLLAAPCCWAADAATFQFCETFDDQYKPVNPGEEFSGPTVSWIATAPRQYGIPAITVSIYKHEGAQEQLIKREKIDVNPSWDTTAMRNMPLPSEGEFTIALTTPDGASLGSGRVKITKMDTSVQPKPQETVGTTLKDLFNRYAPKK